MQTETQKKATFVFLSLFIIFGLGYLFLRAYDAQNPFSKTGVIRDTTIETRDSTLGIYTRKHFGFDVDMSENEYREMQMNCYDTQLPETIVDRELSFATACTNHASTLRLRVSWKKDELGKLAVAERIGNQLIKDIPGSLPGTFSCVEDGNFDWYAKMPASISDCVLKSGDKSYAYSILFFSPSKVSDISQVISIVSYDATIDDQEALVAQKLRAFATRVRYLESSPKREGMLSVTHAIASTGDGTGDGTGVGSCPGDPGDPGCGDPGDGTGVGDTGGGDPIIPDPTCANGAPNYPVCTFVTWTEYCTGGSDPNGNDWQWWAYSDEAPPAYTFVRSGDGVCVPPTATCDVNMGSICSSVSNNCGEANNGVIQCDGSCGAIQPADRNPCSAIAWTEYCTGASDPNGNYWQWWEYSDEVPPSYKFVRPGDGACVPSVACTPIWDGCGTYWYNGVCEPTCPPGTVPGSTVGPNDATYCGLPYNTCLPGGGMCGDGVCDTGEDSSCCADCGTCVGLFYPGVGADLRVKTGSPSTVPPGGTTILHAVAHGGTYPVRWLFKDPTKTPPTAPTNFQMKSIQSGNLIGFGYGTLLFGGNSGTSMDNRNSPWYTDHDYVVGPLSVTTRFRLAVWDHSAANQDTSWYSTQPPLAYDDVVITVSNFACLGVTPANATIYAGDGTGLVADVQKTYSLVNTGVKCEYACNAGFQWVGGACVKPDLIAGDMTSMTVTAGVPVSLSALIQNGTNVGTVNVFTNLFQKAENITGTIGVVDIGTNSFGALGPNLGNTATINYSFPLTDAGKTRYIRVCADKSSMGDTGAISEMNENNNCSMNWVAVVVQTPRPSITIDCGPAPVFGGPFDVGAVILETCIVRNTGNGDATNVVVTTVPSSEFTCVSGCTGPLLRDASRPVGIKFSSNTEGDFTSVINATCAPVCSNAPVRLDIGASTLFDELTGVLDFGNVRVRSPRAPMTRNLVLTNNNPFVDIAPGTLIGLNPPFTCVGTCDFTDPILKNGGTITIPIRFDPTSVGSYSSSPQVSSFVPPIVPLPDRNGITVVGRGVPDKIIIEEK